MPRMGNIMGDIEGEVRIKGGRELVLSCAVRQPGSIEVECARESLVLARARQLASGCELRVWNRYSSDVV